MPDQVTVSVNGRDVIVAAGSMVSAAVAIAGDNSCRESVTGQPRGPLCGMGICFECRVTIDGLPHVRACQRMCVEGMQVQTHD